MQYTYIMGPPKLSHSVQLGCSVWEGGAYICLCACMAPQCVCGACVCAEHAGGVSV